MVHTKPSVEVKLKVLETTTVLALACLVFSFIFHIKWLSVAASILLATYLLSFKLARLISNLWLSFSEVFGNTMSSLLLSLCFYGILTPVSWFYRLFNTDELDLQGGKASYYHQRDVKFDKSYFEKLW
jgi:hypothetical protein